MTSALGSSASAAAAVPFFWITSSAMLTCALRDGSLAALQNLYLYNNPTSRQALDALNVAAGARRPFRQPFFFCPLGNW